LVITKRVCNVSHAIFILNEHVERISACETIGQFGTTGYSPLTDNSETIALRVTVIGGIALRPRLRGDLVRVADRQDHAGELRRVRNTFNV
jgi:hypothetical protein